LKCMKWIKITLCCDCYKKLIYSFTVLNYGPKRLVSPAALRMPEPFMRSIYANITFWRQTSQRLKGNDWTEGQCHVAQTQLHKIQHRSFLILHSQIWIHYPHFYLPRRTFMSSHPVEPMAGCLCPHPTSLLESKIAKVPHMGSVEEKMTVAIKETVDFGWIGSGCSLQSQKIVDGIVRRITRIAIPWWCKWKNRSMNEEKRQRATNRKLTILSHK